VITVKKKIVRLEENGCALPKGNVERKKGLAADSKIFFLKNQHPNYPTVLMNLS
jgi:hypothetical protein